MYWPSLLLGVILGTPAIVMLARGKAPRACAILAGCSALSLIAATPWVHALIVRRMPVGLSLIIAVIVLIVAGVFFYLDIIRGEHRKKMLGRKGGAGAPAGAGAAGSGHNAHVRPLVACLGLVVAGLIVATNFGEIATATGNGLSHTVSSISNSN